MAQSPERSVEEKLKPFKGVLRAFMTNVQQPYHALKYVDRNGKEKRMQDWKKKAEEYFFVSHMKMGDISALTGISRQSISAYLKNLDGYEAEKEYRKKETSRKRREYKTEKQREYRAAVPMDVTVETMRREHELAAMELSHERYH